VVTTDFVTVTPSREYRRFRVLRFFVGFILFSWLFRSENFNNRPFLTKFA
jgi:hypothetical protein